LRQEIDFYVREIILFKLDIKGYKSDIRKLRKITAHMEAFGRTSDLESEVCSLRPTATPAHSQFTPTTPDLGTTNTASPVIDDGHTTTTARTLREPSLTHSPAAPMCDLDCNNIAPRNSHELDIPATLHEMAHKDEYATEADLMNPEASPHSLVPRSIQCQKSTACALTV
jgi:hypothetical protein